VGGPALSVPKEVLEVYMFDRDKPFVGEYQLAFCYTGEFSLFPFLPQMSILSMFLYRNLEHTRGGGAIDIIIILENIHSPGFSCEP
jgi:hypothetical protein